jgi:hypothetical protein
MHRKLVRQRSNFYIYGGHACLLTADRYSNHHLQTRHSRPKPRYNTMLTCVVQIDSIALWSIRLPHELSTTICPSGCLSKRTRSRWYIMLLFPSTIFPVPSRFIVNTAKERTNFHYRPSTAIMVDTKEWDSMRFENASETSV